MPPRRRPEVKSRLEQVPEIKPQASVSSGAFYAPARPQLSTEMDQLGKALRQLGSGVGDMMVNRAKEQSAEDLATGARIALAHMDELRKDSSNALKKAEAKNWLPNGARPDVKEGFLRQAGAIWARSPQLAAHLDDGMETFIHSWSNKAGSLVNFHEALDKRNMEIITQAREHLDNNFYSRDEGFMNAVPEVLAKHRKKWTERYTDLVSINQMNTASKAVKNLFREQLYDNAVNYFFMGQTTPGVAGELRDNKTGKVVPPSEALTIVAPKDLWPAGQSPRIGFYKMVEDHALYDLAKNPHDIKGISDALDFVTHMASMKNPTNKARMDSGLVESHYGKLKTTLSAMLDRAQTNLAARDGEILESAMSKVTALFQLRPHGDGFQYRVIDGSGQVSLKIFDPRQMNEFLEDWKNNRIAHPSYNPKNPDAGVPEIVRYKISGPYESDEEKDRVIKDGFSLTDKEIEALTTRHQFEAILSVVDRVNARLENQDREAAKEKAAEQDQFDRRLDRKAADIIETLSEGGTWSDEDIKETSRKVLNRLKRFAERNELEFDSLNWRNKIRATLDATAGEDYHSSADQGRYTQALTTLASENGQLHWLNKSDLQVEANIRKLFGSSAGVEKRGDELSEAQIVKLTNLFVNKNRAWGKYLDITGATGKGTAFEKEMYDAAVRLNPDLLQLFHDNKKQLAGGFFKASSMETLFRAHLSAYMRRVYVPWMADAGEHFDYDGESFDRKAMDAFLFSNKYTDPERKKPEVISYSVHPDKPPLTRSESLLQQFLREGRGEQTEKDGKTVWQYPNGWKQRISEELAQ